MPLSPEEAADVDEMVRIERYMQRNRAAYNRDELVQARYRELIGKGLLTGEQAQNAQRDQLAGAWQKTEQGCPHERLRLGSHEYDSTGRGREGSGRSSDPTQIYSD